MLDLIDIWLTQAEQAHYAAEQARAVRNAWFVCAGLALLMLGINATMGSTTEIRKRMLLITIAAFVVCNMALSVFDPLPALIYLTNATIAVFTAWTVSAGRSNRRARKRRMSASITPTWARMRNAAQIAALAAALLAWSPHAGADTDCDAVFTFGWWTCFDGNDVGAVPYDLLTKDRLVPQHAYPPVNPCSSRRRSKMRFAVCRCFR